MNDYDLLLKKIEFAEYAVTLLYKRATSKCGYKRNSWKGDFVFSWICAPLLDVMHWYGDFSSVTYLGLYAN